MQSPVPLLTCLDNRFGLNEGFSYLEKATFRQRPRHVPQITLGILGLVLPLDRGILPAIFLPVPFVALGLQFLYPRLCCGVVALSGFGTRDSVLGSLPFFIAGDSYFNRVLFQFSNSFLGGFG